MPQCPHCQAPYDKGQRYCSVCGSFLLHPEEGDTFCPQCGVRVSPRQEFCHECDAPMQTGAPGKVSGSAGQASAAEPATPPPGPTPGPPPTAGLSPWVIGSLAVAG